MNNHLDYIAEAVGTPCYAYDVAIIDRQLEQLRQHFAHAQIFYALKANSNAYILRYLQKQAVGAEAISCGEIYYAQQAQMPVLMGGPRQDEAMLELARQINLRYISLDSASQWENWQQAHKAQPLDIFKADREAAFLIRLNPELDPQTHPHLATGARGSKFGLALEQVLPLAEQLGSHLAGFHVHVGSQIRELAIYDEILCQLASLYARFPRANLLDIGGGFAVPNFAMASFAQKINAFVAEHKLELILEPGRFLIAEAGVLLTRVLHRKENKDKIHIICDASMADLLRPALYQAEHPIRSLAQRQEAKLEQIELQGCLCENSDILAQARTLAPLHKGDIVVIAEAGAYGMSMASNYAGSLRPAEVLFDSRLEPESFTLIRRSEALRDTGAFFPSLPSI